MRASRLSLFPRTAVPKRPGGRAPVDQHCKLERGWRAHPHLVYRLPGDVLPTRFSEGREAASVLLSALAGAASAATKGARGHLRSGLAAAWHHRGLRRAAGGSS
eukprot:15464777-Alexandrium_andersonii.AAC.1